MSEAIVLASGSAIRAEILTRAGVSFIVDRPEVDEAVIKDRMSGEGASIDAIAAALADAKALEVSRRRPGLVLGADQILRFDGRAYDKAKSLGEARDRLAAMRGQPHDLVGAVTLARDGAVKERLAETSRLWMRDFSDDWLESYLTAAGEDILASVGCYQFENLGAQLFERIEGDYFAILGLPLLPVLDALRRHGGLLA